MMEERIILDDESMLVERKDGSTLRMTLQGWSTDLDGGFHCLSEDPTGMALERQEALLDAFLAGSGLRTLRELWAA
ncbi:MAG: hypothetical protein ACM3YO_06595 [Bacteroidota bacterium]